jgi:hypothetical protein
MDIVVAVAFPAGNLLKVVVACGVAELAVCAAALTCSLSATAVTWYPHAAIIGCERQSECFLVSHLHTRQASHDHFVQQKA